MSLNAVKAILMHEIFITKRSIEVINDILLYPLWSIIVFGFMTIYLSGFAGQAVANNVLVGIVLWQVVTITQYSISIGCLWDVWSKNLTNIFIAPISNAEYLTAYTVSGAIKSFLTVFLGSVLSYYVFHFNILDLGIVNLILFY